MDPNQTWRDLADAFQEEDWEAASEHASNLLEWMNKGGFPPTISRHQAFDAVIAKTACEALVSWEFV